MSKRTSKTSSKAKKVPFKALSRKLEFKGPEAIDTEALEFFDYQYPDKKIEIITTSEEFTSVCPFSGLPDFGKLTFTYVPNKKCVELRSLKYYLMSFRNVGIFYEHLANRIRDDLANHLKPRRMEIVLNFMIRGGLKTTIRAEHHEDKT